LLGQGLGLSLHCSFLSPFPFPFCPRWVLAAPRYFFPLPVCFVLFYSVSFSSFLSISTKEGEECRLLAPFFLFPTWGPLRSFSNSVVLIQQLCFLPSDLKCRVFARRLVSGFLYPPQIRATPFLSSRPLRYRSHTCFAFPWDLVPRLRQAA